MSWGLLMRRYKHLLRPIQIARGFAWPALFSIRQVGWTTIRASKATRTSWRGDAKCNCWLSLNTVADLTAPWIGHFCVPRLAPNRETPKLRSRAWEFPRSRFGLVIRAAIP